MVFLCRVNEQEIRQYKEVHPTPQGFCTQALSQDNVYEEVVERVINN
jgi:hypothetical protein